MSNYDVCQQNNWGPGTRLVGDEGYGPTVIEIVFISPQTLLAKMISHNGVTEARPRESIWTLKCRHWTEIAA